MLELVVVLIVELIYLWLALPLAVALPEMAGLEPGWSAVFVIIVSLIALALWLFVRRIFADLHRDRSIRRQKLRRHVQTELRRWLLFCLISPLTGLFFYELSRWLSMPENLLVLSGLLGLMGGAGLVHLAVPAPHVEDDVQDIVRGPRLLDYGEAFKESVALTKADPLRVFWGGLWLPRKAVYQHFQVEGTTGSGKTIAIRLFMQSVLPLIGQGHNHRALIYDPKNELPSLLKGMKLRCPIKLLNPFDQRSWAWDMARDICAPAMALPVAKILIPPDERASQPFFSDAAARLVSALIQALMRLKPGQWTFRELLLIYRSQARIKQVLAQVPEVKHYMEQYLKQSEATLGSIFASGFNKLDQYEFIAALWEQSSQKMSLRDWIEQDEESILILGSDEELDDAMQAVNNLLIQIVLKVLLRQPDNSRHPQTQNRRTFLIIDELTSLGALQVLPEALRKVRSKGGSVVLGFQERGDVEDVFGYRRARTIFANTSHKLYLRVSHHGSADEISKELGTHERLEMGAGSQYASGGASRGDSEQDSRRERRLVLPSELMRLPPAGPEIGVAPGFAQTPWLSHPYRLRMPWERVAACLHAPDASYPDSQPRAASEQYLQDFSVQELKLLGLKYPKPRVVKRQ